MSTRSFACAFLIYLIRQYVSHKRKQQSDEIRWVADKKAREFWQMSDRRARRGEFSKGVVLMIFAEHAYNGPP